MAHDDVSQVTGGRSTGPAEAPPARRRHALDDLDLALLRLLLEQPRAGVREYARLLGVARGTAQARLDKLERLEVVTGYEPTISPRGLGFTDLAYVRLNLSQGVLAQVSDALARIPEVIEVDSIAGDSDLLCQVVSTGPENLEEVIQAIIAVPGVQRSRTEPVLRRRVPRRVTPLIARVEERLPQRS
jgi:DNA-binding Lrp family transcriptional regulator